MQRTARMKMIRGRFTYANVMSTLAVFIAVGGATAFAASRLPKNSIESRQIKAKAVTTGKLANGQPSIGLLAGTALGIIIAVLLWLWDRGK